MASPAVVQLVPMSPESKAAFPLFNSSEPAPSPNYYTSRHVRARTRSEMITEIIGAALPLILHFAGLIALIGCLLQVNNSYLTLIETDGTGRIDYGVLGRLPPPSLLRHSVASRLRLIAPPSLHSILCDRSQFNHSSMHPLRPRRRLSPFPSPNLTYRPRFRHLPTPHSLFPNSRRFHFLPRHSLHFILIPSPRLDRHLLSESTH